MGVIIKSFSHDIGSERNIQTVYVGTSKQYLLSLSNDVFLNDIKDMLVQAGFSCQVKQNTANSLSYIDISGMAPLYPIIYFGTNTLTSSNKYASLGLYVEDDDSLVLNTSRPRLFGFDGASSNRPDLYNTNTIEYTIKLRYDSNGFVIQGSYDSTTPTTSLYMLKSLNIENNSVYCISFSITSSTSFYGYVFNNGKYESTTASSGWIETPSAYNVNSFSSNNTAIIFPSYANGCYTIKSLDSVRTKNLLADNAYYKMGEKIYWKNYGLMFHIS